MMAPATHNFVKIVSDKPCVTYTALRPCFHIGGGVAAGPLVGEAPEEALAMPIRFLALIVSLLALAAPAFAADTNHDIKGLYLLTDYPAVTVQPGTTSTVSLKLRNYALTPERLTLSVAGVPQGWTATLLGGGQPIAAAMPATDDRSEERRVGKECRSRWSPYY